MPIAVPRLHKEPFDLRFPDFVPLLCDVLSGHDPELPRCGSAGLTDAAAFHKVSGFLIEAAAGDERLASWIGPEELELLIEQRGRAVLWTKALNLELARVEPAISAANQGPAILLKGAGLAEAFYPDPALRTSVDIDVMVQRSRQTAVGNALSKHGYGPAAGESPWFMRSKHHAEFERPAGLRTYLVEVHRQAINDPVAGPLDYDSLIQRALPLKVSGGRIMIPSPRDQILLSSLHLVADIARNLTSINDLRLAAEAVDDRTWSETFERAGQMGMLWPLNRALDCVDHFFGQKTRRPEPAAARPSFGPMVAADVYAPRVAIHLGQFAAASWRLRGAYLKNLLWPPRDQMEWLVDTERETGTLALRVRYYVQAFASLFRDRS